MGKYKAALFDVDGTLLNTREGILDSVKATIRHFNLPELTKENEKYFCGPPIQKSMMMVYGYTKEQAQEFANVFRDRYSQHEFLFKAEHYDGMMELLDNLKAAGIKIAIATYKREDYALDLVTKFGFMDYAQVAHGGDNFNKLTKADIIRKCIDEMGLTPEECVMIGDSDNDAIGAQGMGCPFIGVTYGFGFTCKEDVDQYPNIGSADTVAEILKYFE